MRTIVINLDRDVDRWRHVHRMLSQLGIAHQRFPARVIAEDEEVPERLARRVVPAALRQMNRPELGCFLSHLDLWIELAASKGASDTAMMIFEDDVATRMSAKQWRAVSSQIDRMVRQTPLDVLYLGKCHCRCSALLPIPEERRIFSHAITYCTHAYVLTREGARRLLASCDEEPSTGTVDRLLLDLCKGRRIRCYSYHPSLFQQATEQFGSNLRPAQVAVGNRRECADVWRSTAETLASRISWIVGALALTVCVAIVTVAIVASASSRRSTSSS